MPKKVNAYFDTPATPVGAVEAKALTLWTQGKAAPEIAKTLDLEVKQVAQWSQRWPSHRQLHQLATNEVMAKAREMRDAGLLDALEAEMKALTEDHALVSKLRKDLKTADEVTAKQIKDLLSAAESLARRSNSIFDFTGSISEAKPASPLVNINLLTQPQQNNPIPVEQP